MPNAKSMGAALSRPMPFLVMSWLANISAITAQILV